MDVFKNLTQHDFDSMSREIDRMQLYEFVIIIRLNRTILLLSFLKALTTFFNLQSG
jgi:hypothetical protein